MAKFSLVLLSGILLPMGFADNLRADNELVVGLATEAAKFQGRGLENQFHTDAQTIEEKRGPVTMKFQWDERIGALELGARAATLFHFS